MNTNERHKLLTNIYQTDHILHRQLTLCAPQFAGGHLDHETLGLHGLLVNPALSVPNLCVSTQKLIAQDSVFHTTLLFLMK